jgi:hypothetical protein
MLLKEYISLLIEDKDDLEKDVYGNSTYYHGASKPLKLKSIIKAKPWKTEFSDRVSIDKIRFEDFVESLRPNHLPSRLKCIYTVSDVEDLNIAGASEDYIYEVDPIGKIHKADFGWLSEILHLIFDKEKLENNQKAINYANNYWNSVPCNISDVETPWEYLSDGIIVFDEVSKKKKQFQLPTKLFRKSEKPKRIKQ